LNELSNELFYTQNRVVNKEKNDGLIKAAI
jgi:hypothetical protein